MAAVTPPEDKGETGPANPPADPNPAKQTPPAEAKAKPAVKPKLDAKGKPVVKAKPDAKAKPPAKAKPEGEAKPDPNGKPAAEVKAEAKPDPNAKTEGEASPETGITTDPKAKPKGKSKEAAEAKAKVKVKPQPGVWGIDLGQCALKAIRLEVNEGKVVATAFDYVEHPKILSQPDADADQLTREALDKFLSRNTLRGDTVAISVPGQSGLARFVKLPPVEEKKILDIVKFEAKQQIPFNLEEVVWDYQKVSSGLVTEGFAMDTEIGLFAMKRDMVNKYLQHFKDVKVDVHIIQMAPLCLCNYIAYDLLDIGSAAEAEAPAGKRRCVVGLDIGADTSNLVVTDGRRILWQRPIPLGGNHFTRALTKELKLTFAKAEHLKRNATKSGPQDLKQILTALKPVLNDFVAEVQRSLGFFTNTHRDVQVEYMVGLGNAFRLPGLQRFLSEKLQIEVRKLQKIEHLTGEPVTTAPPFVENLPSFAVAYGLAIQGLRVARLQTNLLPPEIRDDRVLKAKKPWALAAAAVLLFGTGWLAWSYGVSAGAVDVSVEPLKDAVKQADDVSGKASKGNTAYTSKVSLVNNEEKEVKGILYGQAERLDWIKLRKFIADSIPGPDGAKLSREAPLGADGKPTTDPSPYARYFDSNQKHSGKWAYDQLLDRVKNPKGPRIDVSDLEPHLVQFNVEAIDARYTDDLGNFWSQVQKSKDYKEINVRRPGDAKTPPGKEGGWVVELRGFTTNTFGAKIIRDGLVDSIARLGNPNPTAAPAAPAAGGAKPAAGAPAPAGAAANEIKDPVIGRVSHVILYRISDAEVNNGDLLSSGVVASLVDGVGGGASGAIPGVPGQAGGGGGSSTSSDQMAGPGVANKDTKGAAAAASGGSTRSSWRPLIASAGHGAGGFGPDPMGGRSGYPPKTGMPGDKPEGSGSLVNKPATGAAASRTQFIVLFIWREPTPSDAFLPAPQEAPPPSSTPGPGTGGNMGGAMPAGGPGTPSSPPPKTGGDGGGGGGGRRIEGGIE
jgi:type IV pilus assembly protein PilM